MPPSTAEFDPSKIVMARLPSKLAPEDFPMLRALSAEAARPLPENLTIRVRWMGDQGSTSECTGYTLTGQLRSDPFAHSHFPPQVCYHGARKFDEYAGENYDGSSVKGACKWAEKTGEIESYHLTRDVDAVMQWLAARKSAVAFGTNWHRDMFTMNQQGFISPTGEIVGGHAYLIYGFMARGPRENWYLKVWNSWGPKWGYYQGRAKLRVNEADALLSAAGEAWGVVKKAPSAFEKRHKLIVPAGRVA